MSMLYRNHDFAGNTYIHIILSTDEARAALEALPEDTPNLSQRAQDIAALTVPLNPALATWIMGEVDKPMPVFDPAEVEYVQDHRFISGEITLAERDALVARAHEIAAQVAA